MLQTIQEPPREQPEKEDESKAGGGEQKSSLSEVGRLLSRLHTYDCRCTIPTPDRHVCDAHLGRPPAPHVLCNCILSRNRNRHTAHALIPLVLAQLL